MTIDRLTKSVTKLEITAKNLVDIQNRINDLQETINNMRDDLMELTDILEDEFHYMIERAVMEDDE